MMAVGCDPETSRAAVALADRYAEVYAIVGWHPTYTKDYVSGSLGEITEMLKHPKVVAMGEIGLDFHWDFSTPEEQMLALSEQLDLAVRLDTPLVFHCRDAYPALLDVLEARPIRPYLFHCFAGSIDDAKRAMALDCYFGVDGPISYKNAKALKEVVREVPLDRLVIETDSPYMPPEPFRGKSNQPAYVRYVNAALADSLGIDVEECSRITTENAMRFFRML